MWPRYPGKPAFCRGPSPGEWESHGGPSPRRSLHHAPAVNVTPEVFYWRPLSSHFLPASTFISAAVCSSLVTFVSHLEQRVVDQSLNVVANKPLLHAIEALGGEGKEEELACGDLVDTTRAQIEQCVLLDLA